MMVVEVKVVVEVAVKDADADAVEAAVKAEVVVESGCWFVRMHPSIRAADVFIRVAPVESDNHVRHLYLSHL
jgi:hypothetical protein